MAVGLSPGSEEIIVRNLTKQYKKLRAVDDLSFTVRSGRVTGFLGPNGAGKTTTLRMLLGLVQPTAGAATIGGRRYAARFWRRPARTRAGPVSTTSG
jgi:ABC-2 type transport system ATP-binding protein